MKVEADFDIDGITIVSVVQTRQKVNKTETISIVGTDRPFEPVTQQLAKKGRGDRADRGPKDAKRRSPDSQRRPSSGERSPRRPRFEAPPELPKRPRPKRLRPAADHRRAVLNELPADQRPIAELALQGMQTVRQKLKESNAALAAEGKPTMPEQSVLQMAENLLPRLRVADWLDRADAAMKDVDTVDLKDLRSVVAAANDPLIERSEQCRELVAALRTGLVDRADKEYRNWLEDIESALGVGRVVRALKLSGQPPKAGAIFPDELGRKLALAASEGLVSDALPERWVAVLEAAAFAPIRAMIKITSKPATLAPEVLKTVQRLGSLLPHIASELGIDVGASSASPKPLRRPTPKKVPPRPPVRSAAPSPQTPVQPTPVVESESIETPVDSEPVTGA